MTKDKIANEKTLILNEAYNNCNLLFKDDINLCLNEVYNLFATRSGNKSNKIYYVREKRNNPSEIIFTKEDYDYLKSINKIGASHFDDDFEVKLDLNKICMMDKYEFEKELIPEEILVMFHDIDNSSERYSIENDDVMSKVRKGDFKSSGKLKTTKEVLKYVNINDTRIINSFSIKAKYFLENFTIVKSKKNKIITKKDLDDNKGTLDLYRLSDERTVILDFFNSLLAEKIDSKLLDAIPTKQILAFLIIASLIDSKVHFDNKTFLESKVVNKILFKDDVVFDYYLGYDYEPEDISLVQPHVFYINKHELKNYMKYSNCSLDDIYNLPLMNNDINSEILNKNNIDGIYHIFDFFYLANIFYKDFTLSDIRKNEALIYKIKNEENDNGYYVFDTASNFNNSYKKISLRMNTKYMTINSPHLYDYIYSNDSTYKFHVLGLFRYNAATNIVSVQPYLVWLMTMNSIFNRTVIRDKDLLEDDE